MKGKIIVIEGTDCSGKETQTKKICEKLNNMGKKCVRLSYPMYDSATGKIIGACLLGKPHMCQELLKQNHSFFDEGGAEVDPLVATLFYAADRRYSLPLLNDYLNKGYIVILDRYVMSNMAHRAGLIFDKDKRLELYKKLEDLEYNFLELPKPDETYFLYMPYEYALELKRDRGEEPDEVESSEKYLKNGEKAYLELLDIYKFDKIDCVLDNRIKTIDEINDELFKLICSRLDE